MKCCWLQAQGAKHGLDFNINEEKDLEQVHWRLFAQPDTKWQVHLLIINSVANILCLRVTLLLQEMFWSEQEQKKHTEDIVNNLDIILQFMKCVLAKIRPLLKLSSFIRLSKIFLCSTLISNQGQYPVLHVTGRGWHVLAQETLARSKC